MDARELPLHPILPWVRKVPKALQKHVHVGEVVLGQHLGRHGVAEKSQERNMRAGKDVFAHTQFHRQHIGVLAPEAACGVVPPDEKLVSVSIDNFGFKIPR